jgi:hypothetical protein
VASVPLRAPVLGGPPPALSHSGEARSFSIASNSGLVPVPRPDSNPLLAQFSETPMAAKMTPAGMTPTNSRAASTVFDFDQLLQPVPFRLSEVAHHTEVFQHSASSEASDSGPDYRSSFTSRASRSSSAGLRVALS